MTREELDHLADVGQGSPYADEFEDLVSEIERAWKQIAQLQADGTKEVNRRRAADQFMNVLAQRVARGQLGVPHDLERLLLQWKTGVQIDK